jgi:hypothetical protein
VTYKPLIVGLALLEVGYRLLVRRLAREWLGF